MSDFVGETPLTKAVSLAGDSDAGEGTPVPSPVRGPGHLGKKDWRKRAEIILLSGPAIIIFLAFVIFPVVMAAYYGFFKWKGYAVPTDFTGRPNSLLSLKDAAFQDALKHNGSTFVLVLFLQGPAAVGFALSLNRRLRGRPLIRVLIFVP